MGSYDENLSMRLYPVFERFPEILLASITIVIGIVLAAIGIGLWMNLPVIPAVMMSIEGFKEVLAILFGAFVAALFGLYSSAMTALADREERIRNVSAGLFYDLARIRDIIRSDTPYSDERAFDILIERSLDFTTSGVYQEFLRDIVTFPAAIAQPLMALYQDISDLAKMQKDYHDERKADLDQLAEVLNGINRQINGLLPVLEEKKR